MFRTTAERYSPMKKSTLETEEIEMLQVAERAKERIYGGMLVNERDSLHWSESQGSDALVSNLTGKDKFYSTIKILAIKITMNQKSHTYSLSKSFRKWSSLSDKYEITALQSSLVQISKDLTDLKF